MIRTLDPRYRYIRPDGDADGQEGVDYLLGEAAILRYAAAQTEAAGRGDGGSGGPTASRPSLDGARTVVPRQWWPWQWWPHKPLWRGNGIKRRFWDTSRHRGYNS
ncbi:hypothetical protein GQ600_6501 [Phytophthora cactorum]|nr:hypothetical protein GQ600_6501 [Phytophthora cactorum]